MATPSIVHGTPIIRQNSTLGTGFMVASRWVDNIAISGTAASYTVPANCSLLRLSVSPVAAAPVYGNLNGAATNPAATLTGTGSFPITNGLLVAVKPGDVLSAIGAAAGFLTIECWN